MSGKSYRLGLCAGWLLFLLTMLSASTSTAQEVIIDNGEAGTFYTGTWSESGAINAYGANSLWGRNGATYTWHGALPETGTYEVYMWWTEYSSRSTSAPVTIGHSGGSDMVYVNQQENGGMWNLLGTYTLDAAAGGTVTITAVDSWPTSYCADAVRFVYLTEVNASPVAYIDSITPNPCPLGDPVTFTGHGTDGDGTVTAYRWRSDIDGELSSADSFSRSDLSEGTHTIFFQVQDNEAAWSPEVTETLVVGQASADLIIDNDDPGTSYTGTWSVSSASDPYGINSLWSRNGATYTWHADLLVTGTYEVYMWWTEYSSRSTSAPVTIQHNGGSETVYVNQQENGGMWNLLGTYTLDAAAGGTVTITAADSSPTSYCADAVMFVLSSGGNIPPVAYIDSMTPNPCPVGDPVTFTGHGTDSDGTVTAYRWRSSIDGELSTADSFSSSVLSEGTHTIFFQVQDDDLDWSPEVNTSLTIDPSAPPANVPPIAYIDSMTPNPCPCGDPVTFTGHGTDSDGTVTAYRWRSSIDGELSTADSFSSSALSEGTHTIFFQVQDDDLDWSPEVNTSLTIEPSAPPANVPPVAYIDSITPNPCPVGDPVSFTGHGTDSDGTVTAYRWRSSIDGELSTADSFSSSALSEGTHTIFFQVQDDDLDWSPEVSQTLVVGQATPELIIDNGDPGTSYTGTWSASAAPDPYGIDSLWSRDGATYTWHANLPETGFYQIYMWWTEYSSRSTSAPVNIEYSGGSETIYINQRENGGRWNYLGTYTFDTTTGATLTINAVDSWPTSYCADAVGFVYPSGANAAPVAVIDSIEPNPAVLGDPVTFTGHGTDSDGTVVAYRWRSSIDGELSTADSFSRSDLSEGSHTIFLQVQDDQGAWSPEVTRTLVMQAVANIPPVAIIDSIEPNPSPLDDPVTFTGYGTDSDGTVVAYNWRSSIDGELSTAGSFTRSDLSEGRHTIFFQVQDDHGAWSPEVSQALAIGQAPLDLVIDNGDPGTSYTGTWSVSDAPDPYGIDSLWSRNGATYTWHANLPATGVYDVYMWWTQWSSRSTSAPVTIEYSGDSHVVYVNQQENGGRWNYLGTYTFDAAIGASVTITAVNSWPTSYCADAVGFVYPTGANVPPLAVIDSIEPNPSSVGDPVAFTGHGTDSDGTVVGYLWRSSIDGDLSHWASFSTSSLSEGTHTIFFSVQDNGGAWSAETSQTLTIVSDTPPTAEQIFVCFGYGWEELKHRYVSMLEDIGATPVDGVTWTYFNPILNRNYIIRFIEGLGGIEAMGQALRTENAHIIYTGHSNYGLGAVYCTPGELDRQVIDDVLYIDDDRIFNYSSPWIGVKVSGMRTGQAYPHWRPIFKDLTSGIVPFVLGDPAGDPPYNYYLTYQVPGDPSGTYYKVESVHNSAMHRFPACGRPAWDPTPDGAKPDATNPDHHKYYITNPDPWYPSFETYGDWVETQALYGYFKENYQYTPGDQSGDWVQWILRIPQAGNYRLFAWWPASPSNTTVAPYTVGYVTTRLDQTINGQQWNEIGEFYFDVGEYSVILTDDVDDGGDVIADAIKIAHVDDPPEIVQADFYANPLYGPRPLGVDFTDQSTGDVTEAEWLFGDGSVSATIGSPEHIYWSSGAFTVTLTVSGPFGTSTRTKPGYIVVGSGTVPLRAEFSKALHGDTLPLLVTFEDRSSGNIASWLWDFGDGHTSTQRSPAHTYTTIGYHTVTLTVTDTNGNSSTETKHNFVRAAIYSRSIDNVDYPLPHFENKTIVFRKALEIPKEELRYARMLYDSCSSGQYYVDTFNRGILFYTLTSSSSRGSVLYLKAYLEGKSDDEIWQVIQDYDPIYDYYNFDDPPWEQ